MLFNFDKVLNFVKVRKLQTTNLPRRQANCKLFRGFIQEVHKF